MKPLDNGTKRGLSGRAWCEVYGGSHKNGACIVWNDAHLCLTFTYKWSKGRSLAKRHFADVKAGNLVVDAPPGHLMLKELYCFFQNTEAVLGTKWMQALCLSQYRSWSWSILDIWCIENWTWMKISRSAPMLRYTLKHWKELMCKNVYVCGRFRKYILPGRCCCHGPFTL